MTVSPSLEHFDFLDREFQKDPGPVLAELRSKCPVAHSDQYDGFWVVTRYEDAARVVQDWETFSSRVPTIPWNLMAGPDGQPLHAPPLTSDPPDHTRMRRVLAPVFSPQQARMWAPIVEEVCEELLDSFASRNEIDVATEYAQNIPIEVIARLMGLDANDRGTFVEWNRQIFDDGPGAVEKAGRAMAEMYAYLAARVTARRENPAPDLIGTLIEAEVDGRTPDDGTLLSTLTILLLAGIDTTWNSIGSTLHRLGRSPADRARLSQAISDPEGALWSSAVEEFLRCSSPASMVREVTKDVEISGQQLRKGDLVLISFFAANHDPEVFDDPDTMIVDRESNRHLVFGTGIHRCPGASLARIQLRVAVQAFLRRYPEFEVTDESRVVYGGGQSRGPRVLPLRVSSPTSA